MKKLLFIGFLVLAVSFLFAGHKITKSVFEFDQKIEKQTLRRKQAALKKTWKSNQQKVESFSGPSEVETVSEKQVESWTNYFDGMDKKCKALNQEYFSNKEYIDAQSDVYENETEIIDKLDVIFNNIFSRKGSKNFFALFMNKVDQCDVKSIEKLKSIYSNSEVCREFESFYFVESVMEASLSQNYRPESIKELKRIILDNTEQLLDEQLTMENSLFVLSILRKIPKEWFLDQDDYLIKEIERYYDEVIDLWKNFGSDMVDLKEKNACNYFQDYFYESEGIKNRVQDLITDLKQL